MSGAGFGIEAGVATANAVIGGNYTSSLKAEYEHSYSYMTTKSIQSQSQALGVGGGDDRILLNASFVSN